jgi:hypothetical protein
MASLLLMRRIKLKIFNKKRFSRKMKGGRKSGSRLRSGRVILRIGMLRGRLAGTFS